jgi:DNA polymerase I-like protein with 3'-5' exonuclease and polymerase domains
VWGWFLIEEGIKPSYQAHDEFLWYCKVEDVEKHKEIIKRSVIRLNRAFNPPIPLEVDYKIGLDYSAVH